MISECPSSYLCFEKLHLVPVCPAFALSKLISNRRPVNDWWSWHTLALLLCISSLALCINRRSSSRLHFRIFIIFSSRRKGDSFERSGSFVSCEIFSVINSDKRRLGLTGADCHVTAFHTHTHMYGTVAHCSFKCHLPGLLAHRTSSLQCFSATPHRLMMAPAWPEWPGSMFWE